MILYGVLQHLDGIVDEVRISTNALIEPNSNTYVVAGCLTNVNSSTIHLWHFNEGVGTTTTDSVGNPSFTFVGTNPAPVWVPEYRTP
jgi:hypothetical protein